MNRDDESDGGDRGTQASNQVAPAQDTKSGGDGGDEVHLESMSLEELIILHIILIQSKFITLRQSSGHLRAIYLKINMQQMPSS